MVDVSESFVVKVLHLGLRLGVGVDVRLQVFEAVHD